MRIARRELRWLWLAVLAVASCKDSTEPAADLPTFDLTGEWTYSFSVTSTAPCSDPGLHPGCGGGGQLELVQTERELRGTAVGRSGCQNCSSAWDYGGGEVSGAELSTASLAFTINSTRFMATLPPGEVEVVTGTATRRLAPDQEAQGNWMMTRVP